MKPRSPIRRASEKRLAANGGRYPASSISKRSSIRKNNKPIPKVNVEATKKRRARNAKRMRGVEYQSARAGALLRSGGRCEFWGFLIDAEDQLIAVRCGETERLQFHEEHYPRGRLLTKDDGVMYCTAHHRRAERMKPHKQHRSGF